MTRDDWEFQKMIEECIKMCDEWLNETEHEAGTDARESAREL